jgi:hypothetical protein
MLLVAELLCMEDIEGVYTMDGLQMWRLETLMQAGTLSTICICFQAETTAQRTMCGASNGPCDLGSGIYDRESINH